MVGIRVKRGTRPEVGGRLAAMENVAYVGYMTGGFDIFIEVFLPDTEGLFTFLEHRPGGHRGHHPDRAWHVLRTEKFSYTWVREPVPTRPVPTAVTRRAKPSRDGEKTQRGA